MCCIIHVVQVLNIFKQGFNLISFIPPSSFCAHYQSWHYFLNQGGLPQTKSLQDARQCECCMDADSTYRRILMHGAKIWAQSYIVPREQ